AARADSHFKNCPTSICALVCACQTPAPNRERTDTFRRARSYLDARAHKMTTFRCEARVPRLSCVLNGLQAVREVDDARWKRAGLTGCRCDRRVGVQILFRGLGSPD